MLHNIYTKFRKPKSFTQKTGPYTTFTQKTGHLQDIYTTFTQKKLDDAEALHNIYTKNKSFTPHLHHVYTKKYERRNVYTKNRSFTQKNKRRTHTNASPAFADASQTLPGSHRSLTEPLRNLAPTNTAHRR